ncbi:MAG: alpha/beta hydrolase [Alphaproteobacteria bacterium]|nr:alpha/beta hydrolase [Alphaproteobacteria bacterium]
MARARVGRIDLAYDLTGPEDGEVVLVVSGLIDTLQHWPAGMVWRLAEAGYRTLRYDTRDCGQSTWLSGTGLVYTLDDLADDALDLLDALGIARAHVIGFSMGGCVAQIMAAKAPDRVASLVPFMSTSRAPGLPPVQRSDFKPTTADPFKDGADAEARLQALLRHSDGSVHARSADEKRIWIDQLLARGYNPAGVARQSTAMRESAPHHERLAAIRAPTTVIQTEEDKYFNRAHGEDLARRVPGARLEVIPGAGHAFSLSLVPIVADLIRAHLSRARARG